jgi:hypothetical protein
MHKQHVLLSLFVAVAVVGVLHHFAIAHFWYWTLWWFDVVMHILGGVALGLAALWFLLLFRFLERCSPRQVFALTLAVVLVVGIGWEAFEFFAQLFVQGHFFPDTFHDIAADVAGGLIAYAYYYRVRCITQSRCETYE